MVFSKNPKVIAASMTLHGIKQFDRVEAAMPMIGAIVQGDVRLVSPHITGTLKRGVSFRFYRPSRWKIILETYGTAEYTNFVEFGTYKMAPRRMFARGSANAYPKIEQYLKAIGA